LKRLELDPVKRKRHYANIYFRAWAIFWDDEFLNRMIDKVDSRVIANLPEELITEKDCFAAVSKSGIALRHVPMSLRSLAICIKAVQNDAAAIAFAPSHLREEIRKSQALEFD
jgi:hypothetical protein